MLQVFLGGSFILMDRQDRFVNKHYLNNVIWLNEFTLVWLAFVKFLVQAYADIRVSHEVLHDI